MPGIAGADNVRWTELNELCRPVLFKYFSAVAPLILKYYIPGVFKNSRNGGGIVWMRSGVQLVASGIPTLLQEQLLCLIDPDFCRALYMYLLVPLRTEVTELATAEDRKIVAEALSSNGVRMLKKAVIDKTEENNTWLGSKWARKISSGVVSFFGGSSDRNTKNTAAQFVEGAMNNEAGKASSSESSARTLKTFYQPLPESKNCVDYELLGQMFKLWSLLLPQASLSSPDSKSWKFLSSFAFSTRVVDRLWAAIHTLDIERFSSDFSTSTVSSGCTSEVRRVMT